MSFVLITYLEFVARFKSFLFVFNYSHFRTLSFSVFLSKAAVLSIIFFKNENILFVNRVVELNGEEHNYLTGPWLREAS